MLAAITLSSFTTYYTGKKSDHFNGTLFYDPEANMKNGFFDVLKWQLTSKKGSWPKRKIKIKHDLPPERVFGTELRVSNVGHVTFLIQTQGLNILTDPVWSERASPVGFAGPKRIKDPGIKFTDLPPIDIVLVSHNHYDHLDLATLERLAQAHSCRIITPLGNEAIINQKGNIEVETYDWGEVVQINEDVQIHIEPMQHWSARGVFDRNKALWAAFTICSPSGNIYFVGDSGYGEGRYFKQAKEKHQTFRLALLPIGAYKPRWFMSYAHMDPQDAICAYMDLGQPNFIPTHYDVFDLADEPYGEALMLLEEAKKKYKVGNNIQVLEVGQAYYVP